MLNALTVTATAVLVLGSCRLPHSGRDAVPSALARYEDVASFLLPGHQSVSFFALPSDEGLAGDDHVVLQARVGSHFRAPGRVGVGPYRGVEVYDLGPSGINGPPAGEPCKVGGYPTGHRRDFDAAEPIDTWVAHVDGRFAVISHSRELLEQALRRTGRLDELLIPFASLPALPAESESVIYLLPRPADRTYWGRPVPIEMMRIALTPDGCLRLWHRQPLPEEFTALAGDSALQTVRDLGDGWQVTTIERCVSFATRWLILNALSGVAIFI